MLMSMSVYAECCSHNFMYMYIRVFFFCSILAFNRGFLALLHTRLVSWSSTQCIGDIFLGMVGVILFKFACYLIKHVYIHVKHVFKNTFFVQLTCSFGLSIMNETRISNINCLLNLLHFVC